MTDLYLAGIPIPFDAARDAPDSFDLFELDGTPIRRWRTETCKSVAPNPRCLCSHALTAHEDGEGECWSTACGCSFFRPRTETRTA